MVQYTSTILLVLMVCKLLNEFVSKWLSEQNVILKFKFGHETSQNHFQGSSLTQKGGSHIAGI